jgi:Fanconi-associated nuclease 1
LHTESSVYTTLFSLLFWDILFGPVPDVFQSPYQAAPLDFHTDSFYLARKEAIDARLVAIAEERHWKEALVSTWNSQHGRICVGISWESYDLDQLWSVMQAVGGPALSVLFRSLAEDQKHSRSGMPDLILWHKTEGEGMEHLLVEVKSARDRLSDAQRHWAWIFHHAGIRMLVCKVKHP